jgi:branched-chain amino acid transport system substrate-binding protein
VTIGTVGAYSGVVGASQGPFLLGLRLWIKMINDRGGLNGHPVNDLIVADDGGDSARNRQLAQQLIEQNKVLALVFDAALDGSGTVGYVQSQGVPFIGGIGTGNYFYESPVYFPEMAMGLPSGQALALAQLEEGTRQGKTKFAVISCVEAANCGTYAKVMQRAAARYGAQVVYSSSSSIAAPDYSSECLNARSAGAEVLGLGMDGASITRIVQSCSRQNYHPTYAGSTAELTNDLPHIGDLQGMIIGGFTMPVAAEAPPLQEFKAALAKYAPGTTPVDGVLEAWATAKVLELGAKSLPDGDVPTLRKALVNGLWAIPPGFDLGFTTPLRYNPGKAASPVVCWFHETIQNGKYVAPDTRRTCVDYDAKLTS